MEILMCVYIFFFNQNCLIDLKAYSLKNIYNYKTTIPSQYIYYYSILKNKKPEIMSETFRDKKKWGNAIQHV